MRVQAVRNHTFNFLRYIEDVNMKHKYKIFMREIYKLWKRPWVTYLLFLILTFEIISSEGYIAMHICQQVDFYLFDQ